MIDFELVYLNLFFKKTVVYRYHHMGAFDEQVTEGHNIFLYSLPHLDQGY